MRLLLGKMKWFICDVITDSHLIARFLQGGGAKSLGRGGGLTYDLAKFSQKLH